MRLLAVVSAAVGFCALAGATPALAETRVTFFTDGRFGGAYLNLVGDDGAQQLTLRSMEPEMPGFVAIEDEGGVSTSSPLCQVLSAVGVLCPTATDISVDLGAGDDRLEFGKIGSSYDSAFVDGGPGADSITGGANIDDIDGGPGRDQILGGGGADQISGAGGFDQLFGGDGADGLAGDAGQDRVAGGEGADEIEGGDGGDKLRGGPDADLVTGGKGRDRMRGDGGDDEIRAADGRRDRMPISCGEGARDYAFVDPGERRGLSQCETYAVVRQLRRTGP